VSAGIHRRQIHICVQTAGLGHITRAIGLAQWVRNDPLLGGARILFFVDSHRAIQHEVLAHGFELAVRPDDPDETAKFIQARWEQEHPDIFVLDSVDYDTRPSFDPLLNSPSVLSTVIFDDPTNRVALADIVLNVLPTLTGASIPRRDDTRYLLGKDYFILAPEFAEYNLRTHTFPEMARRGFAFFGGADGNNYSPIFLDAIARLDGMEWTLLLGPLYPNAAAIEAKVRARHLPVRITRHVTNMARSLFEADLCVLAAGNNLVEAAAVGAPTIALSQNEIQFENAGFFARRCGLIHLGYRQFDAENIRAAICELASNCKRRQAMSEQLKLAIDGLGAARVLEVVAAQLAATSRRVMRV
jgi:spore coat polysaccharide biosynthesis predicted glycosyltransferase SpsG